ncbi:MAG: CoA transferase, partial [Rhodospirillales bacterium]|nr:CoA transferase [Rhodospirillales bacterium]
LLARGRSGSGDRVQVNVHQAVATNTETDVPNWVYLAQVHRRQTGRHSRPYIDYPTLSRTKDGRYWLPYRTYLPGFSNTFAASVDLVARSGLVDPALELREDDLAAKLALAQLLDFAISREHYDSDLWRRAQDLGLPWAPVRRPEENAEDPHWWARDTFAPLDLGGGRRGTQIRGKWVCDAHPWRTPELAARLGQHDAEPDPVSAFRAPAEVEPDAHAWPLAGVKVIDLAWLLASGGAGRYLAAHGADVIKVEHSSRPDAMRWGVGGSPLGGRAEREAAQGPLATPAPTSPNRSGVFNEIHAGKRSIGLDLKTPEGREVLLALVAEADVVLSGFSPGALDRMGLSFDVLRAANPRIISVKQSGLGERGEYGQLRSYGPTAQAFSGLTEMSGRPEPYAPAGIGYSYLDWYGADNMALATVTALYRRSV